MTTPKRIVLIEDNPSDVYLLERALEQYRVTYTLNLVRDGEQALKYLGEIQDGTEPAPDLIILDLNLPRHDGIEVLESSREMPALAPVPIIVLTSSDSPKERDRAQELGVRDYVRKPIMLDEFMAVGGRIKRIFEGLSAIP